MSIVKEKYLPNIKSLLQTGAVRQLAFMIGIALSVALGIVLFMTSQEPTYRALDYQVTQQNMSTIIEILDKAGIKYKINEQDGAILVPAKDITVAKMRLTAGGVPRDDGFNYGFLNEQNNLANSQFIENARYLRALENDLAKTISSIEGISGAKVHIAIPQNTVFADESNKVTASVMLNIAPSAMSDKEKIRSVIQLVAGSVPGLDPKDIAITDQYGHFLSDGLDENSIYSAAQLTYQNNIQGYYEKRIVSMIIPLIGENKASVRVNADIDFTQQENAKEEYDPTKTAVLSEQSDSEEDDSSGASGVPGSLSNTPDESGKDNASGGGSGGSQKHKQSTKNYDVTKSVTYKKSNFASIKSLSVAVVIDDEVVTDPKTGKTVSKPLTQDKINKIADLVKATIGYNQTRGDKVTVVNSGFTQVKETVTPFTHHLWDQVWFWDMFKKMIGIIFGFVILFLFYRRLSNYMSTGGRTVRESAAEEQQEDATAYGMEKMHELKTEGITRLKQIAINEPNRVALIIKNWLGKQ